MNFEGDRIKMSLGGSISYGHLREIRQVLQFGGILIIPSDTCYSLASLPYQTASLRRIANIEPNVQHKEIPLSFSGLQMLEKYCKLTSKDFHAIDKFCPGPVTLVCEMKQEHVLNGLDKLIHTNETIGVRIPDSAIERQICDFIEGPITTCAVRSDDGKIIQNYDDIVSIVRKRIKNVIDNYQIMAVQIPQFKYKEESTVVSLQPKIIGPYEIKVYREGIVDPKKIKHESERLSWFDYEDFT